jgi:uncharacterized protein YjbJ (UPF0337 family)
MGATSMGFMDKAKNAAEKLMGDAKQAGGRHANDQNMEAEGQQDQVAADLKNAGEKAKDAAEDGRA